MRHSEFYTNFTDNEIETITDTLNNLEPDSVFDYPDYGGLDCDAWTFSTVQVDELQNLLDYCRRFDETLSSDDVAWALARGVV